MDYEGLQRLETGKEGGVRIDYGKWFIGLQADNGWCCLYPFNWLPPDVRYWGFVEHYYDGPLPTFGCWFFNVSWRW